MANLKISQLTSGNPAQSGDQIPINRGGANFSITASSIAALASGGSAPSLDQVLNPAATKSFALGANSLTFSGTSGTSSINLTEAGSGGINQTNTGTGGFFIADTSTAGLNLSEAGGGQIFLRSLVSSTGPGITLESDNNTGGITLLNNTTSVSSGGTAIQDTSPTGITIQSTGAGGIFIQATASAGVITLDATGSTSTLDLNPSGKPVRVHEITYNPFVLLSGSGAVPAHSAQRYIITLASAASLTLAAPTVTTDDGNTITIISNTAFAHTLTATGLFNSGVSAAVNLATFAAFKGATIVLMAYQGRWDVVSLNGVVMS
jgi:hypothetical protein